MSESTLRLVEEIRAKVRGLARRLTISNLVYGILLSLGVISAVLLVAALAESLLWMPSGVRWLFIITFSAGTLFLLGWFVGRPLLTLMGILPGPDESYVAKLVGRHYPEIKDRLINFLNLAAGKRSDSSEPLLEGALQQLGSVVKSADYGQVEKFERAKGIGRYASFPVVGLLLFLFINPTGFGGAVTRLMSPSEHFARPAPFEFIVQPGDVSVVKGDSLAFVVEAKGLQPPSEVWLEIRRAGETRTRSVRFTKTDDGAFTYSERNVRDPFSYRVSAGEVRTRPYEVDVVARPFVRSFQVTLEPPSYTGLADRALAPNVGDFAAYPGTRATVDLVASGEIVSGELDFDESGNVSLVADASGAEASFTVERDDTWRIRLLDRQGLDNGQPIEYRVERLFDEYPTIVLTHPAPISELADELSIDIVGRISDDFGFSSLTLFYKLTESRFGETQDEYVTMALPRPTARVLDQDISYIWELAELPGIDLVPGDVIEYYLEVSDNDRYSGYKSTASSVHVLRFPSLTEQFDQLADQQDEVEGDLESLVEDSREVRESFEQLKDELRRKQDGDWDDERQLERLREQQQELESRADELSDKVDEMVDQMQKQDMVSPETLNQFEELKRVFDEINSPELNDALERLRDAMQQLDLSEMQRSLGQVEFNEEQFMERLERALELFKRLRTEQELEEAAKRAEELAERQEELSRRTEDLQQKEDGLGDPEVESEGDPEARSGNESEREQEVEREPGEQGEKESSDTSQDADREELAREQEQSAGDMDSLEELMERIQEDMEELRSAPQEEMDQLMQEMREQNLSRQMEQNSQQIQQGELQKAREGQQQMQQSLQQMSQELQEMQEQMSGQQMQQNLASLRRALDDVLTLSLEQEELRDRVRNVASRDAGLSRFTQQQAELHEGLDTVSDSLIEMSRTIPQMSRLIQSHAGQASMDMSRAVDEMVERRGGQSVGFQKSAMTNLNELALLLSDLMQNLQSQQSGMGGMSMQQMIQQLQQMAGEQGKLNDQIQQMLNDMQGSRLTQNMQQRLQQMARQQEALRRQLEEMGGSAPSAAERLLGDLEQIARQMQESIAEMETRNVDSRTVERQQEILTRLLNAQRSMRERGKENRREGRTGEEIDRASPSELTPDEKAERLRRELLDALETGYAPDYEELIRRYFEVLQQIGDGGETE